MNDWMDCMVAVKFEESDDTFLMDDVPSSPDSQSAFWESSQNDAGSLPSSFLSLDNECRDFVDDWRSPFEMDGFDLPDFPPLTCSLVPLKRANPPPSTLPAPVQYPQSAFTTTLLNPQAQVFSLPYHPSMPTIPQDTPVCPPVVDRRFDSLCPVSPPYRSTQKLNFDISRTLTNAKYSEIFTQFGAQLLVDRHPQFTLQDIYSVMKTGYIYFLKNVKTIVPRIGQEWRFISHVRAPGPGESSDRSYNLLGSIPLRCKVKEWIVGGDLWRMYHFVQGKSAKGAVPRLN